MDKILEIDEIFKNFGGIEVTLNDLEWLPYKFKFINFFNFNINEIPL